MHLPGMWLQMADCVKLYPLNVEMKQGPLIGQRAFCRTGKSPRPGPGQNAVLAWSLGFTGNCQYPL